MLPLFLSLADILTKKLIRFLLYDRCFGVSIRNLLKGNISHLWTGWFLTPSIQMYGTPCHSLPYHQMSYLRFRLSTTLSQITNVAYWKHLHMLSHDASLCRPCPAFTKDLTQTSSPSVPKLVKFFKGKMIWMKLCRYTVTHVYLSKTVDKSGAIFSCLLS